jgi:carbonic anhydrase
MATLRKDIAAIASHPLLPTDLDVAGAIYDVATGKLTHLQA